MKSAAIATLLALLVSAGSGTAQEYETDGATLGYEGGVRFILGLPTGEFGDAVDSEGFGLAFHGGLRPVPAFTFGIGGEFMIYGRQSQTYSIPLVEDFEFVTSNNLASGMLFAQWRPISSIVAPYAEARIGLRYLWTESKLEDEDFFDDDEIARETNYDDFATYFGGGGGLLIRVMEGNHLDRSPSVFIDLKVTHVQGSEAEYLTEGDITIVDDVPIFDPSKSETDLTTFGLGVVLTF